MPQTLRDIAIIALGIGLACGLLLLFCAWLEAAPAACTHYAAPSGSGDTCTSASPCTVRTWLTQRAQPGTVLCLKSGTYRGEDGMLQFTQQGTAAQPITVRAETDGEVLIDGGFGGRPLDCNGSYITVQGVNVANGNDSVLVLRGQHCTAQRVVAWATPSEDGGIENIVDLGGAHNLFEDGGAFGYARKMVACGARGGNGPNTIRRVWSEHNGSPYGSAQGNPTESIEIGYNQNNCTAENVIARRNILSSATEPESPLHAFSTHGSAILGSIVYATAADSIEVHTLLNITPEAGSHAGSGHVTSHMLVQDLVLYAEASHTNIRGMQIDGGQGSEDNVARRIVAVAPQGAGACGGAGWSCSEISGGRTLAEALPGRTIWEALPGVCKRVVNRQLTDVGLWPFPMTARIQAALAEARMGNRDVTRHVARTFGTIPPPCLTASTPEPPEPTPTPEHPALTCTGDLAAAGKISLRCVPD